MRSERLLFLDGCPFFVRETLDWFCFRWSGSLPAVSVNFTPDCGLCVYPSVKFKHS